MVIVHAALAGKWLYSPSKRPEAGKTSIFYLHPLALSYLGTKKSYTEVGSVIYQIDEKKLSFLESDRMCLQADAGVVFLQFLSRETFFCFLFTFGVRKIGTCVLECVSSNN